jgi:hypothetical protein
MPNRWAHYLISGKKMNKAGTHIEYVEVRPDLGDKVGLPMTWTRTCAIKHVLTGNYTFMTIIKDSERKWAPGAKVEVVEVDGKQFLRTDPNPRANDNLDNLPDFVPGNVCC